MRVSAQLHPVLHRLGSSCPANAKLHFFFMEYDALLSFSAISVYGHRPPLVSECLIMMATVDCHLD